MRVVWFRDSYYAYWREGGHPKRTALRTQDRETADRRLKDLETSLRKKASTAAEIMAAYIEDRGARPGIERAAYAWKRLRPVFGHLRPDQIDRGLCRAYVQQRRRALAKDGTIIKELSALRAALRWQDKATPALIEMPPAPPPKSRHITREQYRALREAARRTPQLYLFVILAYTTAGRAAAILDLTWDRVDLERGRIALGDGEQRAKGRATVPMTPSARTALEEAQRAALTDHVIEYGGHRLLSVKRAFAAAVSRAGLPGWITPHVLRHTAAVHMAESGVPIAEIAQFLGHSSESVTYRVYARFSPDYLRRAASALE